MRNFIQILLIVVFSVLFLNQCHISSLKSEQISTNIKASHDSISFYINRLGLEVAEKAAFQGTANELSIFLDLEKKKSKQLAVSLEKFKKLASITKIETVTKIIQIPVAFNKPVPYDFERAFKKLDPHYTISGTVNQSGIHFKELSFINIQNLVVGLKKTSFFKKEFRAEITNSNPYIKTTTLDNFTFTEKNKRFGIGISFGFGFYANGFFVGPSLNYNLITF